MGVMKTPGVYIIEKDAFPNSVVEVATAVPAFIGYTERAEYNGKSLKAQPRRISSLDEYTKFFGGAPKLSFTLTATAPEPEKEEDDLPMWDWVPDAVANVNKTPYYLQRLGKRFHLYYCMKSFFQNGGGSCFVVSAGEYDYAADPSAASFLVCVKPLEKEQEPTMIVIPDAVLLDRAGYKSVNEQSIKHCANMTSRVAILDVFRGYKERTNVKETDCIMKFREDVGINDLKWATAYYPWVDTSIVELGQLTYDLLDSDGRAALAALMTAYLGLPSDAASANPKELQQMSMVADITNAANEPADDDTNKVRSDKAAKREQIDNALRTVPIYKEILKAALEQVNLLPPSAAMAGVYTDVDNKREVWKAPANVSLAGVVKPHVSITHDEQEDLNVPVTGQSVNAIRSFIGEGTLVWGARTLDGNSLDWRYINVRRTMIMLEQSIKLAAKAMVFEPNVANTWVTIKSMIRNFLNGIWKRGGLAGAVPDDAFSVHVGLGETMTSEDILEGILRVTVLVAISRPAEFIEITFQQQMQKS
jgi:phage tail sheath protein FI